MSMVVRCANIHDLGHITKIFVESWQSTYAGILSKNFLFNLSGNGPKTFWRNSIDNPSMKNILLVAEDENADGEIFIATDDVPYSSREIYEAMCHLLGKSVPWWKVPKFLFEFLALVHPRIRYKVCKLFGDEYYSSEKLRSLGFRATRTLKDWTKF